MTGARAFNTALEACRETIRQALATHGRPAGRIPIRWPRASAADRRRLKRALETEFGIPVAVVASETELTSGERAVINAAREIRERTA